MSALYNLTIHEALALLKKQAISAVELTQAVLDRIEAVEPSVQAYVHVLPEDALEQARYADARRAEGDTAPLLGIPLGIKDAFSTQGVETTCGSKILEGYIPPFDATVIRRLKVAGMVMLGKANQDEFAMGSSTENSGYHPTYNPWDLTRVPGGSSGGSAAAVAAGEALGALGTDTGGSVRQPAALCGLVGVRPTYGRCSRYGLVAFASSLDQPGPLTRTVADAALILQAMAGHDPHDGTTWPEPVPDYVADLHKSTLKGLRIGVPENYFGEGLQPDVAQAVQSALQTFRDIGAEIVNVTLPHNDYALPVYYLIAPAEASANLARFDGIRYGYRENPGRDGTVADLYARTRATGFGPEVTRRVMLGTYCLSAGYYDAYYLKAQKVRTLIKADFDQAFEKVDVLVGPTSPVTAFPLGERVANPLGMYLADIFTLSQALAGIPALSLPCGFDSQGLPIGLQIAAPALQEARMFQVAHAYEQATTWHKQRAPLT